MYSPAKTLLLSLLLLFFIVPVIAQQNILKGTVVDTAEKKKLPYSIVALIDLADSTLYRSFRTDTSGKFAITKIPPGKYSLMISYPKMADYLQELTITDTSVIELADVPMVTEAKLLQEVIVTAGVPMRMRGDTLEYTADSFYVSPGSNVASLLKRLPGIEVDRNGKITAQGQEVHKVLVDGDEFFSDDPGLATQYLRADAIDKVQVFDKKSEQAEFSGIDDGKRTKTINLKLKKNRRNGFFGKLSVGGDAQDYYKYDAMGALFNGSRKISLFGTSTRVGNQSLSLSGPMSYVETDQDLISDGTEGLQYTRGGGNDYDMAFFRGSGLPSILTGGVHYSDKWNAGAQKLFVNYRVKKVEAEGWSNSRGTSVLPDGKSFTDKSDKKDNSYSFGQNASSSFTTKLDSFSTIRVSMNGTWGNGKNQNRNIAESKNEKGFMVNNSAQRDSSLSDNTKYGSSIQFQRKFRKEGKTFSLLAQQEYSRNDINSYNFSANNYFDPATGQFKNADTLDQLQRTHNTFESYALRAIYTNRFTRQLGIQLEYGWKSGQSGNTLNTLNAVNGKHEERVDSLSNDYTFSSRTHIAAAMVTWNTDKLDIVVGGRAFLTGFRQSDNDLKAVAYRNFTNLAPQANATLKISKKLSFSANYFGNTSQPTIEQLQPLRRSNNPLLVQIGNPGLKPAFNHSGSISMQKNDWLKGKTISFGINARFTDNQIISETSIDAQNRQVSRYVNLDGIPSLSANARYMWSWKKLNLVPGFHASVTRGGNYALQNNQKVKNESFTMSSGLNLSHHWKQFMYTSYMGGINYSVGSSNIPGSVTRRLITHFHQVETQIQLPGNFQFKTDCYFNFQPKSGAFSTSFNNVRWNAALEKRFLKNNQLVTTFSIEDIMNNNTGYRRTVNGNNVNESDRFVFKRYWLLTATWNFLQSL